MRTRAANKCCAVCGLLLQALKQALEGADFREFADRVSVITMLLP
jgi:hypothetical protein